MKHTHIPMLRDDYGIGQIACAEILNQTAKNTLAQSWPDARSPEYMPKGWRAMQIRRAKAALRDMRLARKVKEFYS